MMQTGANPLETEGAIECLCNGCLRVSRISDYPEDGIAMCAYCGVDICWCQTCMETLAKLRAGVRDSRELGLKISLAEWTWNETDGRVSLLSEASETLDSGVEETEITMVYKGYRITVCSQRDIWGIGGKMMYSSVIRLSDNSKCLGGFFPSTKTLLTEAEEIKRCIDQEISSGNPFPAAKEGYAS